jgi:hypothetical protein
MFIKKYNKFILVIFIVKLKSQIIILLELK